MSTLVRVEPTAVRLVGLPAAGALSAREVPSVHLERIAAAGPGVIVTITAEAAMSQARMPEDDFARSGPVRARLPEPPLRLHPA